VPTNVVDLIPSQHCLLTDAVGMVSNDPQTTLVGNPGTEGLNDLFIYMNTLHRPQFRFALITLLTCLAARVLAQSDLPPLPPGASYNENGFLIASGGGGFQPDDGGPPGLPGGGSGGGDGGSGGWPGEPPMPNFGTNLCLLIAQSDDGLMVTVTLSNTVSNVNYLLLATTNLAGPWVTNQSLLATSTVTVAAPYWTCDYPAVFFKALEAEAPEPLTVKWVTAISTSGNDADGTGLDCSPAVSSATGQILVAIANNNVPTGQLFVVDPVFGQIQWVDNIFTNYNTTISYQQGEITGSAAISSNGTIYVGGLDGYLYSINPNGTTNWQRHAGNYNSVYSTPAIGSNGLIYVASDEAEEGHSGSVVTGVTCFNTNGTTNWFFQPQDLFYGNGGDVDSSLAVGADGSIYFVAEGSRLYALTGEGQLKWFLPLPGDAEPDSTPALAPDGTILVGSGLYNGEDEQSPYLYDVNPDGSLNWIFNVADHGGGTIIQSAPTIDQNGVIYVGSAAPLQDYLGCVFAINSNGTPKWVFTNYGSFVSSSPAIAANGTIYAGDGGADVYAISNGTAIWTYTTGGSIVGSPAILPDGSVLITSEDGNLYCLWGTAPTEANAPWPMFQQSLDHNGQQAPTAFTNGVTYNGAPFVFNGFYTGSEFGFSMTGTPGSSNWSVYASTNLAQTNWTLLASNLTMNSTNGNTNFTDTFGAGVSNKFYVVSRTNSTSQTIGFYKQIIAPGTNLVADQLYQVDDNILNVGFNLGYMYPMNTLYPLFAFSNSWGSAQYQTRIYKWNGTGFTSATNTGVDSPEWPSNLDMTLLPGYSVLMVHTNAAFTNTFVGLVRGEQIFHVGPESNGSPSTNYLSTSVPASGYITNISGYVPHNGDTIKLWNTSTSNYVSYPYSGNSWTAGTPQLAVGQGFLLITTNEETWTNNWQ
jgi:outer membrane protein assembly factor BamB